ncbi:hypothetical protein P0D84_16240 [Paraburkholderia sp. RL17-337-BIB-A]
MVALASVYVFFATPMYTTTALIRVDPPDLNELGVFPAGSAKPGSDPILVHEIAAMPSRSVAEPFIQRFDYNISTTSRSLPILGAMAKKFAVPRVLAEPWLKLVDGYLLAGNVDAPTCLEDSTAGNGHVTSVDKQLKQLNDAKSAFESRFGGSPTSERTYVDLAGDVKAAQTIYVDRVQNGEQLSMRRASATGGAHIVDPSRRAARGNWRARSPDRCRHVSQAARGFFSLIDHGPVSEELKGEKHQSGRDPRGGRRTLIGHICFIQSAPLPLLAPVELSGSPYFEPASSASRQCLPMHAWRLREA